MLTLQTVHLGVTESAILGNRKCGGVERVQALFAAGKGVGVTDFIGQAAEGSRVGGIGPSK